jgi:hypothetical protein
MAVRHVLNHLGRHVVERATCRAPMVARRVHRPAKVGNLEHVVEAHEQVLGLDVAVDHMLAVQVRQAVGHLARELLDVSASCGSGTGSTHSTCLGLCPAPAI